MATNQSVEVYTEQEGICISKEYREAKPASVGADGRQWPASDEKYIVKVVSCTARHFSKETGMPKPMVLDYETDKATFDKINFNTFLRAKVGFVVRTYGDKVNCKPDYFALIEK